MQKGFAQIIAITTAIVLVSVLVGGVYYTTKIKPLQNITDFESCAKAGYPIMESFPERCTTPDEKTFTRELTEEEKEKLQPPSNNEFCIQVITPAKNPQTGQCKEYPTPCDVPQGWEKVDSCDETANWETYVNSRNQFSIKYPPGWKIVKPVGMDPFVVSFQNPETSIYIHVYPSEPGETLTSYLEDIKSKSGSSIDKVTEIKRYKIDDVEVEKSITEEPSAKSGQVSVYAVNSGKTYQLIMPYKNNKQMLLEIFEKMLTTLKFLE